MILTDTISSDMSTANGFVDSEQVDKVVTAVLHFDGMFVGTAFTTGIMHTHLGRENTK